MLFCFVICYSSQLLRRVLMPTYLLIVALSRGGDGTRFRMMPILLSPVTAFPGQVPNGSYAHVFSSSFFHHSCGQQSALLQRETSVWRCWCRAIKVGNRERRLLDKFSDKKHFRDAIFIPNVSMTSIVEASRSLTSNVVVQKVAICRLLKVVQFCRFL